MKRLRLKQILIIGIIAIIGSLIYKNLKVKNDKKLVIEKLKDYKSINSAYPKNLKEMDQRLGEIFHYHTDSIQQSYTISYSSGFIIKYNLNRYSSKTEKWEQMFTY